MGPVMTDWSAEDLAGIAKTRERYVRLRKAQRAPRSPCENRIALVAHERGLTERDLEKFRKGRGRRFDYHAFAYQHGISLDWLFTGDLKIHPRRLEVAATAPEIKRDQLLEFGRLMAELPPEKVPFVLAQLRGMGKPARG